MIFGPLCEILALTANALCNIGITFLLFLTIFPIIDHFWAMVCALNIDPRKSSIIN
jgi:hypothetical protein